MKLENYYGRQSYCVSSDKTDAKISVSGGHITAEFDVNGKKINPFFIAPWWNEGCEEKLGTCEYSLRGVFFGFPFGLNEPFEGVERPCHGFTSAENWDFVSESKNSVELSMDIPVDNAHVTESVEVKDGETVLYIKNTVKGAVGKYPVGYHPTISMPNELSNAYLDMSEYKKCVTSPTHIDLPENDGYCSLLTDYEITDEKNVPTVYGKNVDLTRQPFIKGFDDIYMYVFDEEHEFNWAALSIPSEGYMYYQLKNPKELSNSMIWTSYCGRHYPRWNSRVNGCIEIGAAANYFHYGITSVQQEDPLTKQGFRMCHEFDGKKKEFKLISGVCAIPEGWSGVKSIEKKDRSTIIITGKNGEIIETACRVDFLK